MQCETSLTLHCNTAWDDNERIAEQGSLQNAQCPPLVRREAAIVQIFFTKDINLENINIKKNHHILTVIG